MKICADLHTHTIASDHAFSTVSEICAAAHTAGLRAVAITDHAPAMEDAPHRWHFTTMHMLPRVCQDVFILRGAELNIVDYEGAVDLTPDALRKLDFVIASFHDTVLRPGREEDHTRALLTVADNPLIDCLGHPGQPQFAFDHETVIRRCRETGTLLEINNNSFLVRSRGISVCRELARLCARYEVPVVVNSDAHWAGMAGQTPRALAMLAEISFPERLILNLSWPRLCDYFQNRKGLSIEKETTTI